MYLLLFHINVVCMPLFFFLFPSNVEVSNNKVSLALQPTMRLPVYTFTAVIWVLVFSDNSHATASGCAGLALNTVLT